MKASTSHLITCPRCYEGHTPTISISPGCYDDSTTCRACKGTGSLPDNHHDALRARFIERINELYFDEQHVPMDFLQHQSRIDEWDISHDAPGLNYDGPEFEKRWLGSPPPTSYRLQFWFLQSQSIDDIEDHINESCGWSSWDIRRGISAISVVPIWRDFDPFDNE